MLRTLSIAFLSAAALAESPPRLLVDLDATPTGNRSSTPEHFGRVSVLGSS